MIHECNSYWGPYFLNLDSNSLINSNWTKNKHVVVIYNFLKFYLVMYKYVNSIHSISYHNITIEYTFATNRNIQEKSKFAHLSKIYLYKMYRYVSRP